jgi:hypothetical protein
MENTKKTTPTLASYDENTPRTHVHNNTLTDVHTRTRTRQTDLPTRTTAVKSRVRCVRGVYDSLTVLPHHGHVPLSDTTSHSTTCTGSSQPSSAAAAAVAGWFSCRFYILNPPVAQGCNHYTATTTSWPRNYTKYHEQYSFPPFSSTRTFSVACKHTRRTSAAVFAPTPWHISRCIPHHNLRSTNAFYVCTNRTSKTMCSLYNFNKYYNKCLKKIINSFDILTELKISKS